MEKIWKVRKEMWRNGYHVTALELMEMNYDWELDPMCDCTPARKIYSQTGKWKIEIRKAYIDGKSVRACREIATETSRISKDEAIKIWWNIENKKITMNTVKDYFESLKVTA